MKERLPFKILYEDRDVIVIDKPAGLLTTHTKLHGRAARESQSTAENHLNAYVRKGQAKSGRRVWLLHRLDRETSGVMIFAKSESVAEYFRSDWNNITEKTYLARVEGRLDAEEGVFDSYLMEDADGYRVRSVAEGTKGAKRAVTEWRLLSFSKGVSVVEVRLKSGRKNQIRVHFSEAGHPVVGDVKYGGRKASRLFLHSLSIAFRHPFTSKRMEFASPCPQIAPYNGAAPDFSPKVKILRSGM